MKLLAAVLVLCLTSATPALAATGAAPQPLAIRVQGDSVQATHLPAYDPRLPITISVAAGDKQTDELSVVAAGPAGQSLRVPLASGADGSFSGTLSLSDAGTWRLQLAARNGTLRTLTSPVVLDVASPPPSNAVPIGWAIGSVIFIVFGGGGFLSLRREGAYEAPLELDRAA
jgi:hypothetical protein